VKKGGVVRLCSRFGGRLARLRPGVEDLLAHTQ
jgi:hypothetical protein